MFKTNKRSSLKATSIHSFEILIFLLVLGWLILAIIDAQYRHSFVKIAEFGVGYLFGWMLPKPIFKGKA